MPIRHAVLRLAVAAAAAIWTAGAATAQFVIEPHQIFLAARQGDIVALQKHLDDGVDIDIRCPDGDDWLLGSTPLMWALREADVKTIEYMLAAGANARIRTKNGSTAIFFAAQAPDAGYEKTKMILDAGASVNVRRLDGATPIVWAASFAKDPRIIGLLLDAGADIEQRHILGDMTPLMIAARMGNLETARALIERGADVNATAQDGVTPLIAAADGDMVPPEMLRLLVGAGARVDARLTDGTTALMTAALTRSADRARTLLELGAPPDSRNFAGDTALSVACARGDVSTAIVLLDAGADLAAANSKGVTPLHWAVQGGEPAMVRLLIARGASINAVTADGWTPLLLARTIDLAEPLIEAGADLEQTTPEGWTPLMFAAEQQDLMLIRRLVRRGADVMATDGIGRSALDIAAATPSELQGQAVQILADAVQRASREPSSRR